jgi:penicillin-binding protein-related factor A (putative recombinase)
LTVPLNVCVVCLDAYKSDPYSWKNSGSISYPKNNPEFIKIYYSCINAEKKKDGRCVKHVYISKKNDYDVLVCYQGNVFSFNPRN